MVQERGVVGVAEVGSITEVRRASEVIDKVSMSA